MPSLDVLVDVSIDFGVGVGSVRVSCGVRKTGFRRQKTGFRTGDVLNRENR